MSIAKAKISTSMQMHIPIAENPRNNENDMYGDEVQ